jgi:hypothetical protein
LVDANDEVLDQWIGPVAAHVYGLLLSAESEVVVVPVGAEGETTTLPRTPGTFPDSGSRRTGN